jgi:hypothetical protein
MASYTVNQQAVARARQLIDARQYVLQSSCGDVPPGADHGRIPADSVRGHYSDARQVLSELEALGIDYGDVAQGLESNGVAAFDASWRGAGRPDSRQAPAAPRKIRGRRVGHNAPYVIAGTSCRCCGCSAGRQPRCSPTCTATRESTCAPASGSPRSRIERPGQEG